MRRFLWLLVLLGFGLAGGGCGGTPSTPPPPSSPPVDKDTQPPKDKNPRVPTPM
jgi:hypothetical protein